MREQEVRIRVVRFLRARVRDTVMPAAVGLGLAIGGCGEGNVYPPYGTPFPFPGDSAQDRPDASEKDSLDTALPGVSALDAADGLANLTPPDVVPEDMGATLETVPSLDSDAGT